MNYTIIWLFLSAHLVLYCPEWLQTRQQGSPFLSELKQKLLLSPSEAAKAGTRYNVPLINSLVLYVGMQVKSWFNCFLLLSLLVEICALVKSKWVLSLHFIYSRFVWSYHPLFVRHFLFCSCVACFSLVHFITLYLLDLVGCCRLSSSCRQKLLMLSRCPVVFHLQYSWLVLL